MRLWVSQAGMAVVLAAGVLRPAHGQDFEVLHHFAGSNSDGPDGPAGPVVQGSDGNLPDVPCPSLFADWIEALADEGVTAGCGAGLFCPAAAVTRAQMAVFLLKIEHGSSYAPPACQAIFADVACPSQFADWIEQLYAEDITAGCSGPS